MRVDEEHKKQGNTCKPRQGQAARHSEVQGPQELIRPLLSGCLKICQTSQATDHEMNHRDTDHGFTRLGDILIILR
jgi:hypothetical protein